jgi:oxalate decarboxylase/phosphoglucose isomerase-like protein (cupin superfamily)
VAIIVNDSRQVFEIPGIRHQTLASRAEVPFGPGTTLVIPPRVLHQIVNGGDEEMFLVAALSETPARVFAPDGEVVALPWQQ